MTIDEAVEIETGQNQIVRKGDDAIAKQVIVDRYLWLTDHTPLTVAVIEKELGEPDQYGRWAVGNYVIRWNSVWRHAKCEGFRFTTLGDLRWIVAKLRGGA